MRTCAPEQEERVCFNAAQVLREEAEYRSQQEGVSTQTAGSLEKKQQGTVRACIKRMFLKILPLTVMCILVHNNKKKQITWQLLF